MGCSGGGGALLSPSHKELGKRFGFLFFFRGLIESCVCVESVGGVDLLLSTHDSRERETGAAIKKKNGRKALLHEPGRSSDPRRQPPRHARGNGARKHHIGIANTSRCVFDERAI